MDDGIPRQLDSRSEYISELLEATSMGLASKVEQASGWESRTLAVMLIRTSSSRLQTVLLQGHCISNEWYVLDCREGRSIFYNNRTDRAKSSSSSNDWWTSKRERSAGSA